MPPTIEYVAAYATAATAIGTLALAASTRSLAKKTNDLASSGERTAEAAVKEITLLGEQTALLRQQAEATGRQSEAAERALLASVRPLILDVPRHTHREILTGAYGTGGPEVVDASLITAVVTDTQVHFVVPIRNVGQGVALIVAATITTFGDEPDIANPVVHGRATPAIAPREEGAVYFDDADTSADLRYLLTKVEVLVVEVAYCDVGGQQGAATRLFLVRTGMTARKYRVKDVQPGQQRLWTSGFAGATQAGMPAG